jgi:hypothetical protein
MTQAKALKDRVKMELGLMAGEYFKTAMMYEIERRYQKSIHYLLAGHLNGQDIADDLGISRQLVSLWRKQLGIQVLNHKGHYKKGVKHISRSSNGSISNCPGTNPEYQQSVRVGASSGADTTSERDTLVLSYSREGEQADTLEAYSSKSEREAVS